MKLTEEQKEQRKLKREENKRKKEEQKRIKQRQTKIDETIFEVEQWVKLNPIILFKVGERVVYGNWDEAYVKEIFADGKVYELHLKSHNRKGLKEECQIVKWTQIFEHKDSYEDIDILSYRDDLQLNFHSTMIFSLFTTYYSYGIDMNPDYQRDLVWSEQDELDLIDSIYNNIPIGRFVLIRLPYKDRKTPCSEILDGKQRLNTLLKFHQNQIEYKGKTFFSMHPRDRTHFMDYNIERAVIEFNNVVDRKKLYAYFLKLNTTGRQQNKDHLEKIKKMYEEI